jgi:hypothetical protein
MQETKKDDRAKIIVSVSPESLGKIDEWNSKHFGGTRAQLVKEALETFMYIWEAHKRGEQVIVRLSDGSAERVFRSGPKL